MTEKYQVTAACSNEKECLDLMCYLIRDNIPIEIQEKKYKCGDTVYYGWRTDGFKPSKREDGVQNCGKVLSYGSVACTRGRKLND